MVHASFFSGKGGFDLAAEWMGWTNAFHCEINPFVSHILKYYWPNATSYGNITTTDFTGWRGGIDVLTGGFPCQPYSTAGLQLGTADPRHLWPQFLRGIKEIQPPWVVGENVRGLVSWNGGLVFNQVQADLEAEGYEVLPVLLPAAGVNAPHQRYRIWFIAYSESARSSREKGKFCKEDGGQIQGLLSEFKQSSGGLMESGPIANTPELGRYGFCFKASSCGKQHGEQIGIRDSAGLTANSYSERPQRRQEVQAWQIAALRNDWCEFPTEPAICFGNDGLSTYLDATAVFGKSCKPAHARTFSKWRNEAIKAGGNAIVPQVVYEIFRAIELYELLY